MKKTPLILRKRKKIDEENEDNMDTKESPPKKSKSSIINTLPTLSSSTNATIDQFIEMLTQVPHMKNCFNMFNSGHEEADKVRRNNLKIFLTIMTSLNPRVIIIGEAPGFRGCHWSGVPVCSEYIMIQEYNPKIKTEYVKSLLFGYSKGYRKTSDQAKGYKEATATSVWDIISRVVPTDEPPPMLWNSCFVHSYQEGNEKKNRNPNNTELNQLLPIVKYMFTDLFPNIKTVLVMGRKAEYSLTQLKKTPELSHLQFEYIRHPSQGGKPACEAGITKVYSQN
jgi:uracil-DNA glycosylase